MIRTGSIYRTMVGAEVSAAAQYRINLVVGFLGWTVPFAMMALWLGSAQGSPVGGIARDQFITYFAVLFVISAMSPIMEIMFGLNIAIWQGRISAMLLRPIHPVHSFVAQYLARVVVGFPFVVAVGAALVLIMHGALASGAAVWIAALALVGIGFVSQILLAAIFACLTFWMRRADAFLGFLAGIEFVFGGVFAPVRLLPAPLDAIAEVQPMWLTIGAPAELVAGMLDASRVPGLILVGLGWAAGLGMVFRIVWRRGLRAYEAVGT